MNSLDERSAMPAPKVDPAATAVLVRGDNVETAWTDREVSLDLVTSLLRQPRDGSTTKVVTLTERPSDDSADLAEPEEFNVAFGISSVPDRDATVLIAQMADETTFPRIPYPIVILGPRLGESSFGALSPRAVASLANALEYLYRVDVIMLNVISYERTTEEARWWLPENDQDWN